MTIPLTMRHAKVLAVTKGKDFLQYPPLIKSGSNTRNLSKFCFFHRGHGHEIKECHALIKN